VSQTVLQERLFEALISGDRPAARSVVEDARQGGAPPSLILTDLFWPVYERIERSFRSDQLTTLSHHLGTRLLRVLVDQTAIDLVRDATPTGRRVFAVCGPNDADELGAQMAVDLLEGRGHPIRFAGGGIAMDEILAQVQADPPDVLLLFASAPTDLPEIRGLIDNLNEIGAASPKAGRVQVVVGGGVFNRAEGLAEEIGADLWASDPAELVEAIANQPQRRATSDQRTVGRSKRKHAA